MIRSNYYSNYLLINKSFNIIFRLAAIYDEMVKEVFSKVTVDRIHRVDVSFEIPGK